MVKNKKAKLTFEMKQTKERCEKEREGGSLIMDTFNSSIQSLTKRTEYRSLNGPPLPSLQQTSEF